MDHATKFCHRHSLNGREAAAHFQGHTERHASSAQLIRWRRTPERSPLETSIHVSASLRSVPTFFSKEPEEPEPALEVEDGEENSSLLK